LTTSTDQLNPESVATHRAWSRLIAPLLLLASFLLLASSTGWGYVFIRLFAAFAFLVLSIAWGILARQWIFVSFVVGSIAVGFVGLMVVAPLLRSGGCYVEFPAVANLRTINTAEVTYLSHSGRYGTINELIDASLLDDTFSGTRADYKYIITLDATGSAYTAEAVPAPIVPKSRWWFSSADSTPPPRRYGYYSLPDLIVRYSTDASLAPLSQSGRSVQ
jgi:energy-coupling factor transporter transmembrane protein EcfT